MGGQIYFEDLDVKYGYSCMPDRLHYFSKEENDFRMEVRKWCQDNIEPVAIRVISFPSIIVIALHIFKSGCDL